MISPIFVVLLFCASAAFAANEKILLCYYGTWATYRSGDGKFDVDSIDPELCTHLVYGFAGVDNLGYLISLDPYLDLPDNYGRNNFGKFNALKTKNPKLKTLLAVGGWNEGSAKYSTMAANAAYRQNFVQSSLTMLLNHNFDGLDMDWEYPARRDTVYGYADVDNFTQLLKELREAFDKHGLLVTAAVSAVKATASVSYDIPAISQYLDYINLMTYDMYGGWDSVTGHNAPLYAGEGDEGEDPSTLYTVDAAVKYWLGAGCPPEKLVLGAPLYGRTFILASPYYTSVRAPAIGEGLGGQFTSQAGFMGYNEICVKLQTDSSWTVRTDEKAKVPYAVNGRNWISYDDPTSITAKVEFAMSYNLAGAMVWSIETDDFLNRCGGGDFPLLRTMKRILTESSTTTVAPTDKPTDKPTENPTEEPTEEPTEIPTEKPTEKPTVKPTEKPTENPTEEPTEEPTEIPTEKPTVKPTEKPTENPTEEPTEEPTEIPTENPTENPTEKPTEKPTEEPTEEPTEKPTENPTERPSEKPTENSTEEPTDKPTVAPSTSTTASPSSSDGPETVCTSLGFASNALDCSTFYICVPQVDDSYKPVLFSCPPTLKWDQTNLYCNYAAYVDC